MPTGRPPSPAVGSRPSSASRDRPGSARSASGVTWILGLDRIMDVLLEEWQTSTSKLHHRLRPLFVAAAGGIKYHRDVTSGTDLNCMQPLSIWYFNFTSLDEDLHPRKRKKKKKRRGMMEDSTRDEDEVHDNIHGWSWVLSPVLCSLSDIPRSWTEMGGFCCSYAVCWPINCTNQGNIMGWFVWTWPDVAVLFLLIA